MTRKILAQDQELNIKDYDVDVIAQYSSETNLNSDFTLEHDESNSNTNIMFGQKIKIPTGDNLEEVLVKSINLSKIRDFKNHRRKFYKWEDDLNKEKTPKQWILKEFEDLNREYNEIVDSHFEKTTLRFLFTIAGIGLGLGGALVNPMMLPGVFLTSVKFLTWTENLLFLLATVNLLLCFMTLKTHFYQSQFGKDLSTSSNSRSILCRISSIKGNLRFL